jgi:uracil-DNA glycosylase family 4
MAKRNLRPEIKVNLFDTENGQIKADVLETIKLIEDEQKKWDAERLRKRTPASAVVGQDIVLRPIEQPFACTACALCQSKRNYVLPRGNINGTILLIGEAPGAEEDATGKLFIGPAGKLLHTLIIEAGINEDDVAIANVCMCRPPNNRQPSKEEMETCVGHALWFMKQMPNLKVVILLGGVALQAVLKMQRIMERRGSFIEREGKTFLPTLHPAAILRNINYRPLLLNDLTTALLKASGKIEYGKYKLADTKDVVLKVLDRLSSVEELSVDIETASEDDPNFQQDNILGISFCWAEKTGVYIPFYDKDTKIWDESFEKFLIDKLRVLLSDPNKKLIMHNGKFDAKFLRHRFNIDMSTLTVDEKTQLPKYTFFFDTMLAHHLLWERPPHGLKHLARKFPDLVSYESDLDTYFKVNKIKNYKDIPLGIMYKYAASDADATFRLYKDYMSLLDQNPQLKSLFFTLIMPLSMTLTHAEYTGVMLNREQIVHLRHVLFRNIERIKKVIYKRAGKEFNINSPDQLGEVLYDQFQLTKNPMKTETGKRKVDDEALTSLLKKHKIVRAVLAYRKFMKQYKTYVVGMEKVLDASNRIHPNFKLHGTATGRLSCSKPNLQNIPRGDMMRSLFVAKPGYSLIISDYSQIELRVLAAFSQDPDLIRIFKEGKDIHTEVAKRILMKDHITKEERIIAKGVNFGLIYGRGAKSIAEEVGISEQKAHKFVAEYFKKYPAVANFQEKQKILVHRDKCVATLLGRVRHLPEIDSQFEDEVASAERQSLNSPVQGSAAECTNLATVKLYEIFKQMRIDANLVLSVHDELVFEVLNSQVAQALDIVYYVMKTTAEEILDVPVEVDQSIYDRWIEPKEEIQTQYLTSIGIPTTILADVKARNKEAK